MICLKTLQEKPAIFSHLDDATFFAAEKDRQVFAFLAAEINNKVANLHIKVVRLTPTTMKALIDVIWPELVSFCKQRGCHTLSATKEYQRKSDLQLWKKFIKHFGFEEPRRVYVAVRGC